MPTEITLRQLEYLVAAIDCETMSAAAAALATSTSAVSMGIADLEAAVRTDLVIRAPRKPLRLTPVGRTVIDDVRALLDRVEQMERDIRVDLTERSGRVRLACFAPLGPRYVPDLVAAAAVVDPALTIEVTELDIEPLFEEVADGHIELGLVYGLHPPDSLVTEPVAHHVPYVLLPAEHPLASAPSVRIEDVIGEPMVMLDARPTLYFDDVIASLSLTPHIVHRTDNIDTVRSVVARGGCWSLLIGPPRGGLSHQGLPLVALPVSNEIEPMPVVVAWQAGSDVSARALRVIELCHRVIPSADVAAVSSVDREPARPPETGDGD